MAQEPNLPFPHHSDPRRRVSSHYHQAGPQPREYGAKPGVPPQPYGPPAAAPDYQRPAVSNYAGPAGHHGLPRKPGAHPGKFLLGGSMIALATVVITPAMHNSDQQIKSSGGDICIKQIDGQSLLSRDELKQVLDLETSIARDQVEAIVQQPHCVLEPKSGENGVRIEREAYPLEFDPQTWFVVRYQQGKYSGYDFSFR